MTKRAATIVITLGLVFAAACGGGGGGANDSSSGSGDSGIEQTTYSGPLTQTFTPRSSATGQALTCVLYGDMTLTVYPNGSVSATSAGGNSSSIACQYVGEAGNAEWSGTAANGEFSMTANGSGIYTNFSATAWGTYTETAISGEGTGSVTVTLPGGSKSTFAATYSFTLNAAQ